jgi:hypothetical protein
LWNVEKVSQDDRIGFFSLIREMILGVGGVESSTHNFLFGITEKKKFFGSPSRRFVDNIKVDIK